MKNSIATPFATPIGKLTPAHLQPRVLLKNIVPPQLFRDEVQAENSETSTKRTRYKRVTNESDNISANDDGWQASDEAVLKKPTVRKIRRSTRTPGPVSIQFRQNLQEQLRLANELEKSEKKEKRKAAATATKKKGQAVRLSNFIPYSKRIAYEYYDDSNELCDRLRLLISSQMAGNSNHTYEINSIIDELKENNIIA